MPPFLLRSFTVVCLLLRTPGLVSSPRAAEVRALTLDQALELAATHNRDIAKAAEFRNLAQGVYVAERAAALPQLLVKGTLAREEDKALNPGLRPARGFAATRPGPVHLGRGPGRDPRSENRLTNCR